MLKVASCLGAAVLLAGCQPQSVSVRTSYVEDGLQVTGTATVRAVPTLVVLRLGCAFSDARASAAKANTDSTVKKIIAAVRAAGIPSNDVQTREYRLGPSYDSERRITTWHSSSSLEVRVLEVGKASAVLQAALDAGANRVDSIDYTIEELEKLRAQARDEACRVAQSKADQFAKNFKARVGRPTRISESVPGGWAFNRNVAIQSVSYDAGSEEGGAPESVLSSGSVAVDLTVSVTFALE
ncbi:MAG: SIMPL domain-containing protein [Fimbriimonadaceae bacterium]